ncbi:MAG: hypothetical protein ACREM1_15065 [Longimicrobiales bacterium]
MFGKRRATIMLLALVLAPSAAAAQRSDEEWLRDCDDYGDDRLVRVCDVRVERVPAPGTPIRVDPGGNGGVSIEGWAGTGIEVHTRIQARAETEAEAREIADAVRMVVNGGIAADGPPRSRDANWHISFVVYVPTSSDLDISTRNGPLSVRGVSGRMTLDAQNGPLSLHDTGGDVHARTQNGPITIVLSGDRWQGAGLDAETQNGPLSLTIPEGYNAALETGTTNGPFTSDIPLTVTLRGRLRAPIRSTLGQGGAPIRVITSNGPLHIRNAR